MEENLDEILSEENSGGPPLPSGEEAYLVVIIVIFIFVLRIVSI